MSMYSIGDPIIIAHRGGASEHPENSPAAFEANRRDGFTFIETDAHVTRDGIAVLSHDSTLDRTTNAHGRVSDYTWREISRVKVSNGERAVMRVDEVLRNFPDTVFNIDAKNNAVLRPLLQTIRETDSLDRVCVASFSESRLKKARKLLPGVATSLGVSAIAKIMAISKLSALREAPRAMTSMLASTLPKAVAAQVPVKHGSIPVLTPGFIELAHSRGMAVHVWTINEVDEASRLLALGVDGIITDIPGQMREELGRRHIEVRS